MNNLESEKQSIWLQLKEHYQNINSIHLKSFFDKDAHRFDRFSLEASHLLLDYSKHHITEKTLELLCQLAKASQLPQKIEQLFSGYPVNFTLQKPALHTALRNPFHSSIVVEGKPIMPIIKTALLQMEHLAEQIYAGILKGYTGKPFTDVVNLGIGGSDIGPLMVTEALKPYHCSSLHIHFVANVDGSDISETLKKLNPETTLFIIASKSFATAETLMNAQSARKWLTQQLHDIDAYKDHMFATTANQEAAIRFGIKASYCLPIWEWIGGRYSVWSAVGFPIVLAIGIKNFKNFLAGAYEMDLHFCHSPLHKNMPIIQALIGIWYINFFNVKSHLILPYDHYLKHLCTYIQQLDMESNGKQVNKNNLVIDYATSPIIWGQTGCIGQHSFHQFLYQGTQLFTADFICPVQSHNEIDQHHLMLFTNCISQAQALMVGKSIEEIDAELLQQGYTQEEAIQLARHIQVSGNRPSNMILLQKLTPEALGSLIALYEHKVFVQGCIWDINSFDQWGVNLGKQVTETIFEKLNNKDAVYNFDSSTNGLINYFKEKNKNNAI